MRTVLKKPFEVSNKEPDIFAFGQNPTLKDSQCQKHFSSSELTQDFQSRLP